MAEIFILFLLFTKHFFADFPLQKPYQYLNKGTYGHLGGIVHSGIHGLFTAAILAFVTPWFFLWGLFDAIVHYHIDWAKVQINRRNGWACNTSEEFWVLLGVDQYLHALTYLFIVAMV